MDKKTLGVCGGGITGLLLSLNLANNGHKIHLFADKVNTQMSPMAHAVNHLTEDLLKSAGVWHKLDKHVFKTMHVQSIYNQFNFCCNDANAPYLGHIISTSEITEKLYQACQDNPNIEIHLSKLTQPIVLNTNHVTITCDKSDYKVDWLFAADGANSWVRQQLPIQWIQQTGLDQRAIVATVNLKNSLRNTAWQNLTQHGPIALLPQKNQAALIWSTTEYETLMQCNDMSFCNKVNECSPYKIDHLVTKRLCKPIKTQYANKFYYHRCVLVGDAAHTILPLFGQGANFASLDIKCILNLISHNNLGFLYHKSRYVDNLLFSKASHYFDSNSTNQLMLKISNQLVQSNFIKSQLVKYALGIRDEHLNLWPSY